MKAYEGAFSREIASILKDNETIVAIKKTVIESEAQVRLACELTNKSFGSTKQIAKDRRTEFVLWISGEHEIKKAMDRTMPKENEKCIFLALDEKNEDELEEIVVKGAKKIRLSKKIDPIELERISLSRT
ncbi:hypothetical protein HY990_04705 [Candidatus Micrarchaeota archaeon]|nr:hypothetical protein [Candidatus Micrarchaeota archaeon]